jgi:hypothetical protein
MDKKSLIPIYFLIWIVVTLFIANTEHLFPEKVPSRFSYDGRPISYMDKESFVSIMGWLVILLNAFFVGVFLFIRKLPTSLINMPHKKWYLEKEDRKEVMYQRIETLLLLQGIMINIVLLSLYSYSLQLSKVILPISLSFQAIMIMTSLWMIATIINTFMLMKRPKELE